MRLVSHVPFGRVIWSGTFYTYIYQCFSQAVATKTNKLWASSFFWKCSKLNLYFENAGKNPENIFSFWGSCMWMGYNKLSLLGREHLSTALILLTNIVKLFHITKSNFLPVNCRPVEQQIWRRCCRSDLSRVGNRLSCSFWKGNLKRVFYTYI